MRRQTGAGTIAALTLCCVFGATMLLSLVTGAGVYRRVEERVEESAGLRVGLSYLTARIHSHDERGFSGENCVRAGSFGGADALILRQEIEGVPYETRLYVYQGQLMELFSQADALLSPEDGQAITPCESLRISQPRPSLLHLEYVGAGGQAESADVYLRSGG